MTLAVPPLKCQGIKTKLVPFIKEHIPLPITGTYVEPFCGSCVVAVNLRPEKALLADTNKHIISLYHAIQNKTITPAKVRCFLEDESKTLSKEGADYYYEVRKRFNTTGDPLDFLFLNRSCFNGVMRFNSKGYFNVPFCRKPKRFSRAYITKIVNQVHTFSDILCNREWVFAVADFRETLAQAKDSDFVYVDPPYMGRHVDYYNAWSAADEQTLVNALKALPCKFILSTWHSNKYRTNISLQEQWQDDRFHMQTIEHFYHVGATEDLRNAMVEAIITNYRFSPKHIDRLPPLEQYTFSF